MEAAALVRCPVDIVLGARDQMTSPKQSTGIARALKARITSVEAGHQLMAEAPDAVLAALRRALA
jgi:pimeloyl-ACP methyl ester carboxylesterase